MVADVLAQLEVSVATVDIQNFWALPIHSSAKLAVEGAARMVPGANLADLAARQARKQAPNPCW